MYRCLNKECGSVFEEPAKGFDYVDGRAVTAFPLCPDCYGDDLEELHLCRCGREYITGSQDRCAQCEKEIDEAMKEARERIMNGCNAGFQQATEDIIGWIERED